MSVSSHPAPAPRSQPATGALGAVLVAYGWELRKLMAQKRAWLGFAAAALVPLFFLVSIDISSVTPNDGAYADALGANLRHTGLSIAPVTLDEMTVIGPALLAALVAGDIVASEDAAGTLKTILVRSLRRGHVLAGKALAVVTYLIAALLAFTVVGELAGAILWGFHPLTNDSGTRISALHGLGLTLAAFALDLAPFIAVAAFGLFLSVVTRNSVASVVGTLLYTLALQGLSSVGAVSGIRPYLLVNQFTAWHGFFDTPTVWGPIVRCLWESALYTVPPLVAAWVVFQRRDVDT
ncbi:MAG: type transport system permease protein [Gaiellales bacterium]|jgi:ABC-2 type transport system permease protein|nr:type transport system permease protein [Gaiellales bacterium]